MLLALLRSSRLCLSFWRSSSTFERRTCGISGFEWQQLQGWQLLCPEVEGAQLRYDDREFSVYQATANDAQVTRGVHETNRSCEFMYENHAIPRSSPVNVEFGAYVLWKREAGSTVVQSSWMRHCGTARISAANLLNIGDSSTTIECLVKHGVCYCKWLIELLTEYLLRDKLASFFCSAYASVVQW